MGWAFGAPTRLHWWNSAAADDGGWSRGLCVVRCSSQSELWQPAWNSQLMPQEIPAICHPYKVTFSIRTVIYRQIIPTGSDAEHPVCASHSGLNLLTCLLTHQCAVIIPFPTHFTTPVTSFLPYLSLDQTLLHVLKWVLWRCQHISTCITKYMHFILQLKAHKSIPDTTKPALQWLKSRISLQLWTFCVSLFIRDLRFDWSQQDFLLCVNWITVHATNIYTANDVGGTCHLHFSHITKPSLSEAATFTAPRCETTIDPLMLDKRTVSCCKLSRQNTRMHESVQI